MGRKYDPDEVEMMADLEAMATAAEDDAVDEDEDLDEEDFDWPVDDDEGAPPTFASPLENRKMWGIIAVIFIAIAVGVLYVYQAGDSKTILGNQPIPAAQGGQMSQGAAMAAVNVPAQQFQQGGGNGLAAQCGQCGATRLPMCGKCSTVMQPLDSVSGIHVCPKCGSCGVPICPRCGGHMSSMSGGGNQLIAPPGNNAQLAAIP